MEPRRGGGRLRPTVRLGGGPSVPEVRRSPENSVYPLVPSYVSPSQTWGPVGRPQLPRGGPGLVVSGSDLGCRPGLYSRGVLGGILSIPSQELVNGLLLPKGLVRFQSSVRSSDVPDPSTKGRDSTIRVTLTSLTVHRSLLVC